MTRKMNAFAAAVGLLGVTTTGAVSAATLNLTTTTSSTQVTLVEAEQNYNGSGQGPSNPIALGLNTTPFDGVDRQITFDGDVAWSSSTQWGGRSAWNAGGQLDHGVWHSDHNANHGNNAPRITTSIDVALGDYGVYVVYAANVTANKGGMIQARLHDATDLAAMVTYGGENNSLGLVHGETTGIALEGGNEWVIHVAYLGDVYNTTSLAIDIDNQGGIVGTGSRNLYIGIGYGEALVPEPGSLALIGLGGLTLLRRRRHA